MAPGCSQTERLVVLALALLVITMPSTKKHVRFADEHKSSKHSRRSKLESAPCSKTHCSSRFHPCTRRDCHNELLARLSRRQLKKTTFLNQINTILPAISERINTIHAACDMSQWHGREMRHATAAYHSIMDTKIRGTSCTCVQCDIYDSERLIEILRQKVKAAEKYLGVLRKYRNRYDLEDSSTVRAAMR